MLKTNRRDFIKGTLAGVFGAFLTWAGVVRAEEKSEPVQIPSVWTETPEIESMTTTSAPISLEYWDGTQSWNSQILPAIGGTIEREFVPTTHWRIDENGATWISYDGDNWVRYVPRWVLSDDDNGYAYLSEDGGETWEEVDSNDYS